LRLTQGLVRQLLRLRPELGDRLLVRLGHHLGHRYGDWRRLSGLLPTPFAHRRGRGVHVDFGQATDLIDRGHRLPAGFFENLACRGKNTLARIDGKIRGHMQISNRVNR
jgi:hypothetical protein